MVILNKDQQPVGENAWLWILTVWKVQGPIF